MYVVACKPTGAQVEGGPGEDEEDPGPQRNSPLLGVGGMQTLVPCGRRVDCVK